MKRSNGVEIGHSLGDFCRPDRMALIIYDMQVGVVSQIQDGTAVVETVRMLLDAARAAGMRIVFLRHMSLPRAWMGGFQYRQAMTWQRVTDPEEVEPWFLRSSPGFDIVPELAPRDDEAVIDKITFSAFEGTPLAMMLRDCGLTAFAICGVATEIGIEPTVRHGADLGLVPAVVRDACGSGQRAAGERAFESLAFMGDALLVQAAELVEAMGAKASA
jgi:nicotinamidase-related amidase